MNILEQTAHDDKLVNTEAHLVEMTPVLSSKKNNFMVL